MAASIKASVLQQRGKRVRVICPQRIVQPPGGRFTCTASSKATGSVSFLVTQATAWAT